MKFCPNCGFKLETGHNFCPSCGFDLRQSLGESGELQSEDVQSVKREFVICEVCGEETPGESGYCESCGAKLTGNEEKVSREIQVKSDEIKPESENIAEKKEKSVKLEDVNKKREDNSRTASANKNKSNSGQKQVKVNNQPAGAKRTQPGIKANKSSIKTSQIGIFIAVLLAVGLGILYISGVFSSHSNTSESNLQESVNAQQQGGGSRINLEDMQRINELENTVNRDTTNSTTVLELAHLLNDSGFHDRAIPYYQMYLRKNPGNVDVLVDMGVCYFELRQYEKAKAAMRKGWSINPRHQIANFNLGIVNFSAGNTDSAKIWWRRAIELDPNSEIGKKSKELLDSH